MSDASKQPATGTNNAGESTANPTSPNKDDQKIATGASRVDKPQAVESKPGVVRPTGTPTGRVQVRGGAVRPTRKARLRIARVDPWSVMKTALMFAIAAGIITFVAVALLWSVVEASGALEHIQTAVNALLGGADGSGAIQVSAYIDRWRVLGFTAIVSGINVILMTALATLGAFLYNLSSAVLGGLEVTLAED